MTYRRMGAGILAALLILVPEGRVRATLVINELLPDPAGSDGGQEFVELINTGPEDVSLEEVKLQFGNGADGSVWTTRWSGITGTSLAPNERFLIVDRNWLGDQPGDAEVYLGLQNGPDALRLVRGEAILDMVGYGPLTDTSMMEGDPVSISSGLSIARRPDGRDTDNNRLDFVSADPTPGKQNFQPYSLGVVEWEVSPPSLDRPGIPVRLTVTLLNDGTEFLPTGPVVLRVGGLEHPSLLDGLPPEQARRVTWNLVPDRSGLLPLEIIIPLPSAPDTLVLHLGGLQVGPGDLVLNEVLTAPRHGQGEWIEILVAAAEGIDLKGYSLRDEDGSWRSLPEMVLPPDGLLVLAQDSLALAGWHLDNRLQGAVTGCTSEQAIGCQRNLAGWPSLNNTPTADRDFADRVYLAGPAGNVLDHLTLDGGNTYLVGQTEPGISLERQAPVPRNPGASNWAPSTSREGSTPGCVNSIAASREPTSEFAVVPDILDPEAGVSAVHFMFTLSGLQSGWGLRVYDLWGGMIRDFGGENLGPGPRDLPWDGRDDDGISAGPGGYVAVLDIRDRYSNMLDRQKILLVIR